MYIIYKRYTIHIYIWILGPTCTPTPVDFRLSLIHSSNFQLQAAQLKENILFYKYEHYLIFCTNIKYNRWHDIQSSLTI